MLVLLLVVLTGCSTKVQLEVEYPTCVDWVPDEESAIMVTEAGGDWRVIHTNVVHGCVDAFVPDVVGDGKVLTVREYWDEQTEDDCTVCFDPTVLLVAPPRGSYEIGWYDGDSASPVDVIAFEVE